MLVNCDIKLLRPNRNNLRLMCVLCYAYWWLFAHSLLSICYQKSVPLGTLQTKSALFPPNYLYFSKILVFSLTLMLWIQFRSAAVVTFSMLKFIFRKNGTIQTPNLAYVHYVADRISTNYKYFDSVFPIFRKSTKKKTKQQTTSTDISKYNPIHGCNASFVFWNNCERWTNG